MSSEEVLKRALERERQARHQAEEIAEQATRRLHLLNLELDAKVQEATRDLEAREEELRHSHNEVSEALKLRDYFLASMTHELRSPLHSVLGLSEALLEEVYGPLNERQKRALETVYSSGDHLLEVITNVLEVSKLAAGQAELELEYVDVHSVCQEALALISKQSEARRLQVSLEFDESAPKLYANTLRVRQILVNLLSNAVKFTPPEGSIQLTTHYHAENDTVELAVHDTGIGIAKEDFPRLFKPFSQLDMGLDRQAEGSGLGLLLVQRMVDLYGGGISFSSEPGQGSHFRVSLPVSEPESPCATQLREAHQVLVIDDSSTNRLIMRRMLESYSLKVLEEVDGLLGVEAARHLQPELILLDLYMPKLDGFDVLRLFKADPELSKIPVAIVSAMDTPANREECFRLGADTYFTKPLERQALQNWLVTHIGDELLKLSEEPSR